MKDRVEDTASMSSFLLLLWYVFSLINSTYALSPISVKGTKLYNEDGTQFFVKGITYQLYQTGYTSDPILDNDQCQIDAGLMNTLGINTIRVHTVDGTQSHDACMSTFASQGIYVWVDLPSPDTLISSDTPDWNLYMYDAWTSTMDMFAYYDNLLAFGIGNEIISNVSNVAAAPFIKAAARDIKTYRDARQYREIPIAYTTGDELAYRAIVADYLACGDQSDSIDMYGLDTYSWCGNSSVYDSGYDNIYEEFEGLNKPVLFSEIGCNDIEPRVFTEISTILGPVFSSTFSGVMVFEWAEASNDYGVVSYTQADYKGYPTTLDGYNALKTVFANASPVTTASSAYTPSMTPPACPTSNTDWPLNSDIQLPTIEGLDLSTVAAASTSIMGTQATSTGTSWPTEPTSTNLSTGDSETLGSTVLPKAAVEGVSIAGALIVFTIAWFIRVRRLRAQQKIVKNIEDKVQHIDDENEDSGKSELPAISSARIMPKSELDTGSERHELSPISPLTSVVFHDKSPSFRVELDSRHRARYPLEMHGSLPVICELEGS